MTTIQIKTKTNVYGRISEHNLLISPLKDYGLCSGCNENEQDLFLTLNRREIKKGRGKKSKAVLDNIEQYCYDCASTELTKLTKKNVQFIDFNPQEKQSIISRVLGELAYLLQREKGNMVDEKGKPIPNKYELQESIELEKQKMKKKQELEKKGIVIPEWKSEDGYFLDMNKHRDHLMVKAEIQNQAYEKVFGKLFIEPGYRKANYAPKLTETELKEVEEKANIIRQKLRDNKLDHCSFCQREYKESEVGTKYNWFIEGVKTEGEVSLATSDKAKLDLAKHGDEAYKNTKLYCSECVNDAQSQIDNLKSFGTKKEGVNELTDQEKKKAEREVKPHPKCNECDDLLNLKWLEESFQNDLDAPDRLYCKPCYERVKKGIFRCQEHSFCNEIKYIDTRDKNVKFAIDLNHNIFCWSCWIEDDDEEDDDDYEDEEEKRKTDYLKELSNEEVRRRGTWCNGCDEVFIDPKNDEYEYDETGRIICMNCHNEEEPDHELPKAGNLNLNKNRCYKCKQKPKFGKWTEANKFQCEDEELCNTISELFKIISDIQESRLNRMSKDLEEMREKCDELLEGARNSQLGNAKKKENGLVFCQFCGEQFFTTNVCPPCRKRDVHWGKPAPQGACQVCLRTDKPLTQMMKHYYCVDCLDWNEKADGEERTGIGMWCGRFEKTYCDNCGECPSCVRRKGLVGYPTRDLMIEVMERGDFEALLSHEDDGFKRRYGEIMWELEEFKHLTLEKIRKMVDDDVIRNHYTKRKFSRGT